MAALAPANLERRVVAASTDLLLLTVCCGALLLRFSSWSELARGSYWVPFAAMLAAYTLLEAATGLTPGKLAAQLRVVATDRRRQPSASALVIRAAVKAVPVILFVLGLWLPTPVGEICWGVDAILFHVYATAYYFAVARRGKSCFDIVAGTTLARVRSRQESHDLAR